MLKLGTTSKKYRKTDTEMRVLGTAGDNRETPDDSIMKNATAEVLEELKDSPTISVMKVSKNVARNLDIPRKRITWKFLQIVDHFIKSLTTVYDYYSDNQERTPKHRIYTKGEKEPCHTK